MQRFSRSALIVLVALTLAAQGQLIAMCGDCRLTVERAGLVITYTAEPRGVCWCRDLDVRAAGLTSIDNSTFSGALFPHLQVLDLSENQITDIADGAFAGLNRLERLDLSRNMITKVTTGTFRGLANLHTLYLDQNRLSFVDRSVWASVEMLWHLHLQLNPGAPFASCPACSAASLGCTREVVELPVFRVGAKSIIFTFVEEQASLQVKQSCKNAP